MRSDDRAFLLQDWTERLSDLVDVEMWDGLNTKLGLHPNVEEPHSRAEAYAKAVERIYWKLHEQVEALEFLTEEAQRDANLVEEASRMFRAWEEGLCPSAVKANEGLIARQEYYGQALEEIALYRHENSLSYADTEQAIEIWAMQKRRLA